MSDYLKEQYGFTLFGDTPPGTCPECGIKHPDEQPHNRDSLCYQYKFYDKNGRLPTWLDAIKHCSDDVKSYWKEELTKRGIPLGGDQ